MDLNEYSCRGGSMAKKQHGQTTFLIGIALAYLAIAIVMFFPLAAGIANTAPGNGAFAYTNLLSFWWIDHALFNGMNPFKMDMIFYPVGAVLPLQYASILTPVVFGPLGIVSTAFAYNIALFAGFMLSGFFMFVLARHLTHSAYGSFAAGLVFEFSAIHIAGAYTSMPLLFVAFMPLFVYFMIRAFTGARYTGSAIWMGVSLVLASLMGSIYQALLLEALFIFAFVAYIAYNIKHHDVQAKRYIVILLLFAAAAIIAGAAYAPLLNAPQSIQEEQAMSTTLLSFFVPSYYNGLAHSVVSHFHVYYQLAEYRSTYIGYVVLALALLGAYARRRTLSTKMLVLLAFFSCWLALGPSITLNGTGNGIGGLFVLYSYIPYFNIMQEPVYFDLLATLAIAVLFAYGVEFLMPRLHKNTAVIAIAIISLLVLAGNNGFPIGHAAQSAFSTHVTVPTAYKTIAKVHGNFSVLTLPSIYTPSNGTSALYASETSFYTSIMGKPIIGGYSENENFTDIESVYNVPLAIQATNLAYFNEFSYSSPVVQNYTNQTLLTLYNYGTGIVVVDKSAYNESSLLGLTGYMLHVFGDPVYNGANNIAFETARAINASVYRSFVAYPMLNGWLPVSTYVNATSVQLWGLGMQRNGSLYGAVTVYAPYGNATAAQAGSNGIQEIAARIGFDAYSPRKGAIEIGELYDNRTVLLGAFNTSASLRHYMLNATLASGPYGNILFFITQQSSPAYLANITFS